MDAIPAALGPRVTCNFTKWSSSRWKEVRVGSTYDELLDAGFGATEIYRRVAGGMLTFDKPLPSGLMGRRAFRAERKCIGPLCNGKRIFTATHKTNHICRRCTAVIACR